MIIIVALKFFYARLLSSVTIAQIHTIQDSGVLSRLHISIHNYIKTFIFIIGMQIPMD